MRQKIQNCQNKIDNNMRIVIIIQLRVKINKIGSNLKNKKRGKFGR